MNKTRGGSIYEPPCFSHNNLVLSIGHFDPNTYTLSVTLTPLVLASVHCLPLNVFAYLSPCNQTAWTQWRQCEYETRCRVDVEVWKFTTHNNLSTCIFSRTALNSWLTLVVELPAESCLHCTLHLYLFVIQFVLRLTVDGIAASGTRNCVKWKSRHYLLAWKAISSVVFF